MPCPGTYDMPSDFDGSGSMNMTKAFSFGISREAYEKVYVPTQKGNPDKSMPGPGSYTLLSTLGREARKYSLQGRTPYHQGISICFIADNSL